MLFRWLLSFILLFHAKLAYAEIEGYSTFRVANTTYKYTYSGITLPDYDSIDFDNNSNDLYLVHDNKLFNAKPIAGNIFLTEVDRTWVAGDYVNSSSMATNICGENIAVNTRPSNRADDIISACLYQQNSKPDFNPFGYSSVYNNLLVKVADGAVFTANNNRLWGEQPYIIDANNDGVNEVIALAYDQQQGAYATLFMPNWLGIVNNKPKLVAVANTPHTKSDSWLNFVAVADFDADGISEFAFVEMSIKRSDLLIYTLENGNFKLRERVFGVTNHIPQTDQNKAHIIYDFDADGKLDIGLLSHDLRDFVIISYNGAKFTRRASLPLDARVNRNIISNLTWRHQPDKIGFIISLTNGQLVYFYDNIKL
jgi:hypothetical protein